MWDCAHSAIKIGASHAQIYHTDFGHFDFLAHAIMHPSPQQLFNDDARMNVVDSVNEA